MHLLEGRTDRAAWAPNLQLVERNNLKIINIKIIGSALVAASNPKAKAVQLGKRCLAFEFCLRAGRGARRNQKDGAE